MNRSTKIALLALSLAGTLGASAQTTTTITNFAVGTSILDDDPSGLASAKIISTPITYLTGVKVNLKISGTFNGDLYCYLAHGANHAVLLNRVGRRASSNLGYGDHGFDVKFDDAAANGDVHIYRLTLNGNNATPISGPLTNVWAPDGRTNSPDQVLDTNTRTALLSGFNGSDANGEWVLFVADVEAGDISVLDNWGLELTGYSAPSIVANPANQSAECSTGSATFSVTAAGSAPLGYQWRFGGNPISGATNSSFAMSGVTTADAGNYDVVVANSYGSITSAIATLTVQDTTAPVVTLNGAATMTVECHGSFVDPGASASDLCAGPLSVSVSGSVNPNTTGNYTLTYSATDPSGNTGTATRTVNVVDTTAPVVTLNGAATVTVECHGSFVDPGASASDLCAGPLSVSVSGSVNPNTTGNYTLTYSATDPSGNTGTATRIVHVVDTTAPVVTLNGAATVTVECHSSFVDPGATASDLCAGLLSVSVSGSVNPNATGNYTLTYSATDPSGNTGTATRTVNVVDTTPPTIACSSNLLEVTTNTSGVAVSFTTTATDLCSGTVTVVCNPASGSVFPIGTTTVQCMATDASSNVATCSFTVTVELNHAPLADDIAMGAVENHPRNLLIEKLLAHADDVDDDELSVVAVSATSTNGGTVTLGATNVVYMPATNFVGTDLFTYTVSDGRGGLTTASVIVTVTSENDPSLNRIGSLTITQNGVVIRFAGIPGSSYTVERSSDLVTWAPIGSFTVPDDGIAEYTDANPPAGQGYYRTVSP